MSYAVIKSSNFLSDGMVAYECASYKDATIKINTLFQRKLKEELKNNASIDQQHTVSKEGYAILTWMDGRFVEYQVATLIKESQE